MISKKSKLGKSLAVVMAAALVVTGVQVNEAQAAKKAKLSTKKITVQVGKKKTIKIKNKQKKAKYTFKSKKTSIAKVTKKGVVTGKKKGKTTIVVKEKNGKKTRKLGKVTVNVKPKTKKTVENTPAPSTAPTAAPSAAPGTVQTNAPGVEPSKQPTDSAAPAPATESPNTQPTVPPTQRPTAPPPTEKPTPTQDPYKPAGEGWVKLDLSAWSGGSGDYLESGDQILLDDIDQVTVPLPEEPVINKYGDEVEVLIRGAVSEDSMGFRFWLANSGTKTMSWQYLYVNTADGETRITGTKADQVKEPIGDFKPGEDFHIQTVLQNVNWDGESGDPGDETEACRNLLLKAYAYGEYLDGVTITGIWVRYGDDIGSSTETPDNPGKDDPGKDDPGKDDPVTPPVESGTVENPDVNTPPVNTPSEDEPEDEGWINVDLSTADAGVYDAATGLTLKDIGQLAFTLTEEIPANCKVEVSLTGTDRGGSLFRVWTGGYQSNRTSDVAMWNNKKCSEHLLQMVTVEISQLSAI